MIRPIALAALLSCVASTAALSEEWSHSYTVSGAAELRVDAKDGSVTVRAWDQKTISARVSAIGWKIGSGGVEVLDHQSGDRVDLDLRVPRANWGNFGRRSIRVEI
jgi:hypothetical protein